MTIAPLCVSYDEAARMTSSLADHDAMIGRTLEGRYTITARIGAGSMGTVYRAQQRAMGRDVAIKILRADRAIDNTAKARFMREARANSLLASPNTVTVFDFGQSESGEFYLAMELLEGESLGQRLARLGRLPAAQAVDSARQALRSLAEAHAKGIIHRDLKPDNLFFARVLTRTAPSRGNAHEEIVKVLDFGIAKMLRNEHEPMGVVETQAGTVFGTPRYMSPEQAQGKTLDARTDLYSLGVILYQMLTGRPPFTDDDAVVVMARHIKSNPKPLNEANPDAAVPKELEAVVLRSLSKDPADRQPSAEVFAGELLAALEAQGANTSGVRAALTNAAGIRVPESMRPPAISLPPASRWKSKLKGLRVMAIVIVVVVVAALGAILGVRSGRSSRTTRPAENTAMTPRLVPPTSTDARTSTPMDARDAVNPPTVTPDALPKAPVTSPPKSDRPFAKSPKSGTPGTTHTGVRTAPTSSYGVFE